MPAKSKLEVHIRSEARVCSSELCLNIFCPAYVYIYVYMCVYM